MKTIKSLTILLFSSIILAACSPPSTGTPVENTAVPEPEITEIEEEQEETLTPEADADPPRGAQREFSTDFSIHSIDYDDVLSGGPSKDGIPAIDSPQFISVEEADEWIGLAEPVIWITIDQEVKAYPIQILMWHEIVNDTIAGLPVVVTFCPLCNTAIAFERTVDGQVLDFGTTGRLRFSNLIMYDRQTETWWQQGIGEAIVGSLTGTQLAFVPAAMISWEDYKTAYPDGLVLSRDTGYTKAYGNNPYPGYDDVNRPPFLYQGPATPGELAPVARILALEFDGEAVAYPYDLMADVHVINDRVGDQDVVIFWEAGTASALDNALIAQGQDVGSAVAYDPNLDGQVLRFQFDGENIIDNETESSWDILGRAVSGPLSGERLDEVVSVNYLWFAWAAFKPETRVYQPDL